MAPIRVRHPKGVSTLNVDFDAGTVQDLQQQILSVSEILPSQQDLKSGYPPRSLTLVPELPLASLGISAGDQIIVTQRAGSSPSAPFASSAQRSSPSRVLSSPLEDFIPSSGAYTPTPAPARSARGAAKPSFAAGQPDFVETDAGVLVHRVVPDDNSCLFSSVALVFEQDISKAPQIRKIVADAIRNDPSTWSEAILGRPRDEYISTILKPTSWGGAIELAILAAFYNTEISSIDVETGRIDRFTPADVPTPTNRCILIYSGIHYDATSLAPLPDAPADFHQTLFAVDGVSADSDPILQAATELAGRLRARRAYTNTATFDLKCEICKKGLKGEKEARAHAQETGHTDFGEY